MKTISVFIPTFNGEEFLEECLNNLFKQKVPKGYQLEVIVTDSGSTDQTLAIVEKFKDRIVFNTIPNKEFGHGRTRQQAAETAKGEYILYLTQDATPAHQDWLSRMIEPFLLSDKVGLVFGPQIPRPNAPVTIKREINGVFRGMGPRDAIIIQRHKSLIDNTPTNGQNGFFSDVNSAIRRDLLVGEVPFRDLPYAEDQALAKDMDKAGYLKAYAPQGEVFHSNMYTTKEYFYRKFDEYVGLQKSIGLKMIASYRSLLLGWIRPTLADTRFAFGDKSSRLALRIKDALSAPGYNMALQAGKFLAAKAQRNPALIDRYSLEKKRQPS